MKSRADLVRGWLEKARRDLIVAERELGMGSRFTDIICFHSQQACEKGLKALLTAHGRSLPRTHVLEDLALFVADVVPEAGAFVQELAQLTPYAVAARYPEFAEPELEEAEAAVAIARRLLDWIQGAAMSKMGVS